MTAFEQKRNQNGLSTPSSETVQASLFLPVKTPQSSLLGKVRAVFMASWALAGNYLQYRTGIQRRYSLVQAFLEAQLALGERMYAVGIDDGQLGWQIALLDEKIVFAPSVRAEDSLAMERERLLRLLADRALEDDAPLPGADVEFAAAKDARAALEWECDNVQ